MLHMAPLSSRNEFGKLLNERGLLGSAVEVGTHRGDFAKIFMDSWKGKLLYCIDPWDNPEDYKGQAARLWGDGNRDHDYTAAEHNLRRHKSRIELVRNLSSEQVKWHASNSLDFVHLDGNHEPPYVEEDIRGWWPKIRVGGILAGHDIVCPGELDGLWGRYIQPAVFKFAEEQDVDVQLIVEEGGLPWSYYIIKKA